MKIRLPGFTTAGYFSVGVVVWLYAGAASVVGVPRVVAAMTRKPRVRRRGCDAENSRACRICECVEAGKCNFSRRVRTVSFWSFFCADELSRVVDDCSRGVQKTISISSRAESKIHRSASSTPIPFTHFSRRSPIARGQKPIAAYQCRRNTSHLFDLQIPS